MKYLWILKAVMLLQCIVASQHSVVHEAKRHIRAEVRSALGSPPPAGSSTLVVHRHSPPSRPLYRTQHHYHHRRKHHDQPHHHKNHQPTTHRLHHRWSSNADRGYLGGRSHSPHHSPHHHQHHHHQQTRYTGWSQWSECGGHECVKRRERLCRVKRKCGHTKQVEERKCWSCEPSPPTFIDHHEASFAESLPPVAVTAAPFPHGQPSLPQSIIINAAAAAAVVPPPVAQPTEAPPHHHHHQPVTPPPFSHLINSSLYGSDEQEGSDFYVLNTRPKWKAVQQPDYDEDDEDDNNNNNYESAKQYVYTRSAGSHGRIKPLRNLRNAARPHQHQRKGLRQAASPHAPDDGVEGDIFQYEDFDFDVEGRGSFESQYNDSYEDGDELGGRNASSLVAKEKATPDALLPRHKRVYSKWSRWTKCSPKCTTRRYKKCRVKEQCGREVLREIAYCYTEGSFCQQWLQAQMQKNPPYELKPVAAARRREISYGGGNSVGGNAVGGGGQANAIVNDYIMNGKGYRGPEYTPMKLKCGIAGIRNGKRNMYNMLKIIGGKPARKGEWPWQVAIINRFKEAFCGGTLIAPQWVLTAAHCVRKLLYVRVGEHNLDYEDGTELQMRVLKSFKHPNFDKKTVDSDVALLRLPKAVNATSWIGFSCLPHPYQPLPKNVECTVIGWGKRRNRDIAGTSVLHQAEVPIIPMDNCRSVYQDYTITKNMFCAGHKRRRIDTCAGDSGGPLLCRDSTKPNHPWTIFGITSFGDGCAKRNKFGIYAKVPNYVDWVWSVINCNGNCKLHQRAYE